MPSELNKFDQEDDDFEIEKAPKRYNYRKIKLNIKQEMISKHLQEGISISELSKLFHLSYSTIAHIIKIYKQKKVVFQSKRSKMMREVEQSVKKQDQQSSQKQAQEEQKCSAEIQKAIYYPCVVYWSYPYV